MTKEKQKTAEVPPITETTIGERGAVLPIGIPDKSGAMVQAFEIRPWRMKEERELAKLRDDNKNANLAEYVSMVLGAMCTKLGPHNFDSMNAAEKRLAIGQMYMPDVFYAYIWLRIQALGEDFKVQFSPIGAREPVTLHVDLNSTTVKIPKDLSATEFDYELKTPIEIRGAKVSKFHMGTLRWNVLEQADEDTPQKAATIVGMIKKCDGIDNEVRLTETEIDDMTKRDFEALLNEMDERVVGPVMAIETEYKGREYKVPIDWTYDSFFAISSE